MEGHRDSLIRVCTQASVVPAIHQNAWTARAESGGSKRLEREMDSDKRSKIEVLLRMLLAAQKEVQMIIASRASETGSASRDAVARLENAYVGLQEVMDDLEAAAGIDWMG